MSHITFLPIDVALRMSATGVETVWYFGASFTDYLALRQKLGDTRVKSMADDLNRQAERHRHAFLAIDQHLWSGRALTAWLASDLAERNPLISSLQLDCCRALTLLEVSAGNAAGRHVAVIDDASLGHALAAVCRRAGHIADTTHLARIDLFRQALRRCANYLRDAAGMLRRHSRIAAVRRRQGHRWQPVDTLVVSWGNSSKRGQDDGAAKDSYLGDLPAYAVAAGGTIGKLLLPQPWLEDPAHLAEQAWSALMPDDLWRKRDIFLAGLRALAFRFAVRTRLQLAGYDLSPLVRRAVLQEMTSWRLPSALMYAGLVRRLRSRGRLPRRILLPFENQPWEKVFQYSLHAAAPDIEIISLQHMPFARHYLSLVPTATDQQTRATADRILLTGPRYRDWLVEAGLPEDRLSCIGSLRLGDGETNPRPEAPAVLCCCPIDRDGALELALRAAQACRLLPGVRLTLNLHPACSAETQALVRRMVGEVLPAAEVTTAPAAQLFSRHGLVLYNTSGVCFEAIRHDRPILLVPSEISIDMAKLAVPGYIAPAEAGGLAAVIETILTDPQATERALVAARAESDACIIPLESQMLERLFQPKNNAIHSTAGEK